MLLSLNAGRLALDLAPDAGGSIVRFAVDGESLLRPVSIEALASAKGSAAAAFPLVPFSNRIANGRLVVDGHAIRIPTNWPGVRHPMHGEGWARPWTVARHDARSAELTDAYDGTGGWPFRYRARQVFRLREDGLVITMAIENLESRPVPAGIGLHPFFKRDADTTLAFRATDVWLGDKEVLPTRRIAVPSSWDFSAGRAIVSGLDNCFDGWDGRAVITWPGRRLTLDLEASPPFRHAVVYTPPEQAYFCVEPVSHANGQVARSLLAPGAVLSGDIAFRLSLP